MSVQDPVSDMLVRIKNAHMRNHETVAMPASKVKSAIAKLLKDEGYINDYEVSEEQKPTMTINLKYYKGRPVIESLSRVSRPGLRKYCSHTTLPKVYRGMGVAVISTSKGMMTDRQARNDRLGGEIICKVM